MVHVRQHSKVLDYVQHLMGSWTLSICVLCCYISFLFVTCSRVLSILCLRLDVISFLTKPFIFKLESNNRGELYSEIRDYRADGKYKRTQVYFYGVRTEIKETSPSQ